MMEISADLWGKETLSCTDSLNFKQLRYYIQSKVQDAGVNLKVRVVYLYHTLCNYMIKFIIVLYALSKANIILSCVISWNINNYIQIHKPRKFRMQSKFIIINKAISERRNKERNSGMIYVSKKQ